MKFFNFLICFFFFTTLVFSQNKEYNFQTGFYSEPSIIKVTESNKIIIGFSYRNDIFRDNFLKLIVMSELGEILWEYDDLAPQGIIGEIILLEDQTFYVTGRGQNACDWGGGGFLYKFDEIGNVLLSSTFDDQILNTTATDTFPNGDLILINRNSLQRRTPLNELIWEEYFEDSYQVKNFSDIITVGDDFYITGEPQEGEDCDLTYVTTDFGLPVYDECRFSTTVSSDTLIKILYTGFNETYHFISGIRYYIGYDAYIQGGSSVFENSNFTRLRAASNYIYILDAKQKRIIRFLNEAPTSFPILPVDILDLNLSENDVPIDFSITNDEKIMVLGKERSTHKLFQDTFADSLSQSATFIKEYTFNESNDFLNYDAGVSSIRSEGNLIISTASCNNFGCNDLVDIQYEDLYVTIFNHGDHVINSIHLNANYPSCENCDGICHRSQTFTKFYDNLNLAPQQMVELSFGDLFIKGQNETDLHEVCFWTSVPENKTDKDQTNDLSCEVFNLATPVNEIEDKQIDLVYISNTNEIQLNNFNQERLNGTLEIFDIQGKNILKKKISTSNQTWTIPFNYNLNLYIVKYQEDNFIYSRKFINH